MVVYQHFWWNILTSSAGLNWVGYKYVNDWTREHGRIVQSDSWGAEGSLVVADRNRKQENRPFRVTEEESQIKRKTASSRPPGSTAKSRGNVFSSRRNGRRHCLITRLSGGPERYYFTIPHSHWLGQGFPSLPVSLIGHSSYSQVLPLLTFV